MNYPVSKAIVALAASLGGYQFYQNYQIQGLDQLSLQQRERDIVQASPDDLSIWNRPETNLVRHESQARTFPSTQFSPASFESNRITVNTPERMPVTEPVLPEPTLSGKSANTIAFKPIHMASFNLQGFGRHKVDKATALDKTARLCRNFEVVALQGIIGPDRDLMPRLVDAINQTGARYDYLETYENSHSRVAILFDTDRIETDRRQMYRVADPNNQLTVDPLVGWFRVKGLSTSESWTFSLVNVWISPARVNQELPLVPEIIRAVQNDGRGEDDIIVAGAFAAELVTMRHLVYPINYVPATVGVTTDIYNRTALDHILVPIDEHREFTGRSGALDFLRVMNLTLGEAEEVSDRLPVWAEFTSTEGS